MRPPDPVAAPPWRARGARTRPLRAQLAISTLLAALAVLVGGCAAEDPGDAEAPAGAEAPALTREEIQRQAEAMSPAMAESLGIVDTTIRIESPMPAESVRIIGVDPDSAVPR